MIWQDMSEEQKQELRDKFNMIKHERRVVRNTKSGIQKVRSFTEEEFKEYNSKMKELESQYDEITVDYRCDMCGKVFTLPFYKVKELLNGKEIPRFCSLACGGKFGAIKSHKNKTTEQQKERSEKISESLKIKYAKEKNKTEQSDVPKKIKPISIRSMVITHQCAYCGKEFELSYEQRKRYIKQGDGQFYCSRLCKDKADSIRKTKERFTIKCAYCGKEFIPSSSQFTKYNKDNNCKLFCSRYCAGKYSGEHTDYTSRTEKMKELFKDKEWVAKRAEKIKQTNLQKYGVENPFQADQFKEKAKQTKKEKYNDINYNNRDKFFQTCTDKGIDIYASRPEVGKKVSEAWKNKTEEQKQVIKNKLSIANTKAHNEMTLQKKLEISATLSKSQKKRWENTSDEDKSKILHKVFSNPNISIKVISKLNKSIAHELNISKFEFPLGKYSYDLYKEPNILIEINPTYTHNCLNGTWYGSEPKSKEYHRDKTQYALDNGYKCIQIFDWDNINKIKYLLQNKQVIYARQLNIKSVSDSECDDFLENYHLQGTCRNQIIRFGLYYKDELIELMTFGKPRYNKNYEWELLRLCTRPEYKVVGGAERLFKHFTDVISPNSIISYCDFSKFTGEVYNKLGFIQKGIAIPSKHWCKGSSHITDNLLRQRGFDQLFGTDYGKGTSNEELMIQHGWLPIYDCGQLTFTWHI